MGDSNMLWGPANLAIFNPYIFDYFFINPLRGWGALAPTHTSHFDHATSGLIQKYNQWLYIPNDEANEEGEGKGT